MLSSDKTADVAPLGRHMLTKAMESIWQPELSSFFFFVVFNGTWQVDEVVLLLSCRVEMCIWSGIAWHGLMRKGKVRY